VLPALLNTVVVIGYVGFIDLAVVAVNVIGAISTPLSYIEFRVGDVESNVVI